jgi:hypothetical protein
MSQTKEGALKRKAFTAGLPLDLYLSHVNSGLKWCLNCNEWHPISEFGSDSSRSDGLVPSCKQTRNQLTRIRYSPKLRPQSGRRFVPAEDGNKRQAKARINYFVFAKLIPSPNSLPCSRCSHEWKYGEKRHEYHHHMGYAAENHENVIVLCVSCHKKVSKENGECKGRGRIHRKELCRNGHPMRRDNDGGWRCHECRLEYWKRYYKERRIHGKAN